MTAPKKPAPIKIDIIAARKRMRLNQGDFWKRYGVTQSGGSRYESGRTPPKPIRMLMALDLGKANGAELATGELAARV